MSHLQEVISGVSRSYSRSMLWRNSEALVVRLQAVSRGFLIRQKLEARRRHLMRHTPAVVVIQVRVLDDLHENDPSNETSSLSALIDD